MPTYNPNSANAIVASQAYITASTITSNPKIYLALFEAGFVESNFQNLTKAVDHDSLGYLQQRPSAGWPNPTSVATATTSFVKKAIAALKANPGLTASQLAQKVQVSAYPSRYADAESAARTLLLQAASGQISTSSGKATTGTNGVSTTLGGVGTIQTAADAIIAAATAQAGTDAAGNPVTTNADGTTTAAAGGGGIFDSIAKAITDAFEPLKSFKTMEDQLFKIFLPSNIIRAVCGIAGFIFLLIGIVLLAREVRDA